MAFGLSMRGTGAARGARSNLHGALTAPERSSSKKLLCLPTAPALPVRDNGDFGTSPIYGQLSDKPLLAYLLTWGAE